MARKLCDCLEKVVYVLVCILLVLLLSVTLVGVLPISAPWVEEASALLFGWVIFLGAGVIMRPHGHVCISTLLAALPPRSQALLYCLNVLIIAIIAVVITAYGIKLTSVTHMRGQQSLYLHIPYSMFYAAVPVGSSILAAFAVEALFRRKSGIADILSNGDLGTL